MMKVPDQPKIYHIVHVDSLPSILADEYLWCDSTIVANSVGGTTIGMGSIKQRRLTQCELDSHPGLYVGDCVPFYFCPRSIMLYVICQANHPELSYKGGQGPILHLEADLHQTVAWAQQSQLRWAFSLTNAGSLFFEDRCDLAQLEEIDWGAVNANNWQQCKDGKQAEFLCEAKFPWSLVERVGVHNNKVYQQVMNHLMANDLQVNVEVKREWYY